MYAKHVCWRLQLLSENNCDIEDCFVHNILKTVFAIISDVDRLSASTFRLQSLDSVCGRNLHPINCIQTVMVNTIGASREKS